MISYKEALSQIISSSQLINTEVIKLNEALNRVAAQDIKAKVSNPNFNNSAMDGFAVCAKDLKDASQSNPVSLQIKNIIAAGDKTSNISDHSTTASEIMTGAKIPKGYDSVVKIEDVIVKDNLAIFTNQTTQGNNIRIKGEDFKQGELLLKKSEIITPEYLMLLSSAGIYEIEVFRKVKVAIISTGKELASAENILEENQIYDSNTPYLKSVLDAVDVESKYFDNIYDDEDVFAEKIKHIRNSYNPDIIISTGAVSKGKWDFIPESIKTSGFNIIFHTAKIRPGKPILFAKSDSTYFFGLPGNPRAVTVGFRFFTYPLIRKLQGLSPEKPLTAKLKTNFNKKNKLKFFVVGQLHINSNSLLEVDIAENQESFRVKLSSLGNCFAMLDEQPKEYKAGEEIEVFSFFNKRLF